MKYTKGGEGASAQHPWADVQSTRVCTRHLTCSPRATPSRCVWPIAEPRPRTSPHTSERETRAMALGDAPTTSDANARRADARACGEGKRGCAVEQAGTSRAVLGDEVVARSQRPRRHVRRRRRSPKFARFRTAQAAPLRQQWAPLALPLALPNAPAPPPPPGTPLTGAVVRVGCCCCCDHWPWSRVANASSNVLDGVRPPMALTPALPTSRIQATRGGRTKAPSHTQVKMRRQPSPQRGQAREHHALPTSRPPTPPRSCARM